MTRAFLFALFLCWPTLPSLAQTAANGASLENGKSNTFHCDSLVRPMMDMSGMVTFYKPDKTQSEIDRARMAQFMKKSWPMVGVQKRLSQALYALLSNPKIAADERLCIIRQTEKWAEANAMLSGLEENDPVGHRQAILELLWTSIAFANAVSISDQVGSIDPPQKQVVTDWFEKLSDQIRVEFTPRPREPNLEWLDLMANHRWWAGAAIGSMALVTGNMDQLHWSMNVLHQGIGSIGPDGSMPLELQRGTKGLYYQNFAMEALAMMVQIAESSEVELSAVEINKLELASRFTLASNSDPSPLATRLGYVQEQKRSLEEWTGPMAIFFKQRDPELSSELQSAFLSIPTEVELENQLIIGTHFREILAN